VNINATKTKLLQSKSRIEEFSISSLDMLTINLALDIDWVRVLDMNCVANGRKLKFTKVDWMGIDMQVVPEFPRVKAKHKSKIVNYIGCFKAKQIQFHMEEIICGFCANMYPSQSVNQCTCNFT